MALLGQLVRAVPFVAIIPKGIRTGPSSMTSRVMETGNLTDKQYAIWSDPGYPDQILLGAPRSYELSALMKF